MFIIHRSARPMALCHRGRSQDSSSANAAEVEGALIPGEMKSIVPMEEPSPVETLSKRIADVRHRYVKTAAIAHILPTAMSSCSKRLRGLEEFVLFSTK